MRRDEIAHFLRRQWGGRIVRLIEKALRGYSQKSRGFVSRTNSSNRASKSWPVTF